MVCILSLYQKIKMLYTKTKSSNKINSIIEENGKVPLPVFELL